MKTKEEREREKNEAIGLKANSQRCLSCLICS